ncbi:MAG: leucine-rich repeat domain-containing protein [Candidatus Hodarchaeota archaeon]
MASSPKKIYEDYIENYVNRTIAIELLISIIENSENESNRFEAIEILDKIKASSPEIFKLYENLMISDLNSRIRARAILYLPKYFVEEALLPLKWAIRHEDSYECLINIIKTLENYYPKESHSIFLEEIKKIRKIRYLNYEKRYENRKFKKALKKLIKSSQIKNFSKNKLAEILINYFTIQNLSSKFPNMFFELESQNALVRELDLSDYLEHEVKGTPWGWKNNIQSISEITGLENLKNLKSLDLSNNLINDIKDLIELKNLTHLILSNNKISHLENLDYIKKLPNLKVIDLSGNDIVNFFNPEDFKTKTRILVRRSLIE